MTIARHLGGEVQHISRLARVRRQLLAILLPGIVLCKLEARTHSEEYQHVARSARGGAGLGANGGGIRAEGGDWREMVTTGVGAGVSAVKQVRARVSAQNDLDVGM